jgi:hypothetical protein
VWWQQLELGHTSVQDGYIKRPWGYNMRKMQSSNQTPAPLSVSEVQSPQLDKFNQVLKIIDKLPIEAISEGVKTWSYVVKANKMMDKNQKEFEHKIALVKNNNTDKKDMIKILIEILSFPEVKDDMRMQLITSICNIAEGRNG